MASKPKRKYLTLSEKKDIIRRRDEGQGARAIGRVLGLNESTIRRIYSQKTAILKSCKAYGPTAPDSRSKANCVLVKVERYLASWLGRKESENVPVDKRQIKEQAMVFYKAICKREKVEAGSFRASHGWLYRFLKRKNIRNVRLTGETHSADEVAAKEFPGFLRALMEEKGYHPDCIFNMDESGLQYKKMPSSTFLAKAVKQARGRKVDKSRITVLFCVNQTGTHKMTPLIVHTAKHPRCYKNLRDMSQAPVYWRSSKKAWVTSSITHDWLLNCFVPEAKRMCRTRGHEFKVLLLMDNCPAHKPYLQTLHPAVEIVFLPPNTTSIIQPLDQEIISCVKAKYHELVFRQLRDATESNVELRQIQEEEGGTSEDDDDLPDLPDESSTATKTVQEFWKAFTVKDAIDNLMVAWKDINEATVKHGWKKVTPHLYPSESQVEHPPPQNLGDSIADAVTAAREIPGFSSVTHDDILELHADIATSQDIMESLLLEDQLQEEQEVQGREDETQGGAPNVLTMSRISGILAAAEVFKESLIDLEVCPVRSSEMVQAVKKVVSFYSEMHDKKMRERKQSLITRFLKVKESEEESDESDVESVPDSMFDQSVVDDVDFDGFMADIAGPSTSDGSGSQ